MIIIELTITDIDRIAENLIGAHRMDATWSRLGVREAVSDYFDDPDRQPDLQTKRRIANRIEMTLWP